jgi:hypothetical protein
MRATLLAILALTAAAAFPAAAGAATQPFTTDIVNFDARGGQVVKPDINGDAVDAHDGDILRAGQRYYLYGTSYDCGYGLLVSGTRFCGFKVYSSSDLAHWRDEGFVFDADTPTWAERCSAPRFGCYRPHVAYNARTHKYVLWINGYDNQVNYRVFTADSPTGPFVEGPEPQLAINRGAGVGLNNGDHDLFVDRDGTAYLAYTDIRAGHRQKVEKLDPTYTTGTGEVADLGVSRTEAPSMFRRGDRYYVAYSDPTCAYCPSTGTSYLTAEHPLGPWHGEQAKPDSWSVTPDATLQVQGGGVGLSRDGADWTDYTFAFRAKPLQTAVSGGAHYAQAGWAFRASSPNDGYIWIIGNYPHPGAVGGNLTRVRVQGGQFTSIQVVPLPFAIEGGRWYDVATTVDGDRIETRVDGQLVDSVTDPTHGSGKVGFRESSAEGESAEFDDVRVTAQDGTALLADDFSSGLAKWDRPPTEWQGYRINATSCGGQPSFVAEVPTTDGPGYVFGSDLWNGRPNQALATYFWTRLTFRDDGSIAPYACDARVPLQLAAGTPGSDAPAPGRDANSAAGLFRQHADIGGFTRAQTFTAGKSGVLREIRVTTFQTGDPDQPLVAELARQAADGRPGEVLASRAVAVSDVGWSAREVSLQPDVKVVAGDKLAIVLRSATSRGAFGFGYDDADPYAGGGEMYRTGADPAWHAESGRDLRFETFVSGAP